ncbi:MAG: deoxyribodipyrimidine photo-lyase, partial [Pseudomonadota bacterium]
MQVVWFKRDLRAEDHRALTAAAEQGPVLPLYVVEPELWAEPDMSARQWDFVCESLNELRTKLGQLGQALLVRYGGMTDCLEELRMRHGITTLWSHEETGNGWTYQRDLRVADWCRANGVVWYQLQNHGVVRRLSSRDGWAKSWDGLMAEPVKTAPALAPVECDLGVIPSMADLGFSPDGAQQRQTGGRTAALQCLDSFLHERGESYRKDMSSPSRGAAACS